MPNDHRASTLSISYDDLVKRLDSITTRLSDKLRALALGVIAFCWALLAARDPVPQAIASAHHNWILWTAILAIFALLCDLLQSLINYAVSSQLRRSMELKRESSGSFQYDSWLFRLQAWLFWIKNITVPLSCCLLLLLLLKSLR
jgi:hypothetical protein